MAKKRPYVLVTVAPDGAVTERSGGGQSGRRGAAPLTSTGALP